MVFNKLFKGHFGWYFWKNVRNFLKYKPWVGWKNSLWIVWLKFVEIFHFFIAIIACLPIIPWLSIVPWLIFVVSSLKATCFQRQSTLIWRILRILAWCHLNYTPSLLEAGVIGIVCNFFLFHYFCQIFSTLFALANLLKAPSFRDLI